MRKLTISGMVTLLIVLLSNCVYGSLELLGTFKVGEPIEILQICATCTSVNITSITSPNSNIILSDSEMSRNGSRFNYTLQGQQITGIYNVCGIGDLEGKNSVWCYTFNVSMDKVGSGNFKMILVIGISMLTALFIILTMWSKEDHPFLTNFFFLGIFWFATIDANLLWRIAYDSSFLYHSIMLMIYRIFMVISMLMTFIVLTILTVDVVKIRKIADNPIDNYRDNLGKNE